MGGDRKNSLTAAGLHGASARPLPAHSCCGVERASSTPTWAEQPEMLRKYEQVHEQLVVVQHSEPLGVLFLV